MPHRVSPTERIRGHIDELFASGKQLPEILEQVARLGAQLLMQAALEAEITEFLGRDRYQRAVACDDARPGSRNGYPEVTVKTTAGPVQLSRPKLRGTTEAFASRLFGSHVTKTNALESLVIASFVRGLSVRDVEAALAEALGDQAAISKSTVSAICGQIKDEYQGWAARRLDGITLDYLFLDASFFRMHPGSPAEPVLAAWGITTDGKPAFIGLAPGSGESADAWADFLADVKERGLPSPLLVISDGAPGLITAIEQAFPRALRQRCLIHPSREKCPGQGPGRDAGRDQGRLLEAVRHRRPHNPAWPQARPTCRSPDHRDGRPVRRNLPGGGEVPARRPRGADRLPAVSPPSTTTGSGTRTSSSGPSARPAAAPRSSAGSPARPPASPWSGPCWTAPPAAGAA
jgi:hypothetical protein